MTMSLDDAFRQVSTQARQYEAIQVIAAAFKDLEAFDNLRSERERLAAESGAKLDDINAAIAKGQDTLKRIADAVAADKANAEAELAKAKDRAKGIIEGAQAEGETIAAEARGAAQRTLNDARKELDGVRAGITAAQAELEAKQHELSQVEAAAADAEKRRQAAQDFLKSLAAGSA